MNEVISHIKKHWELLKGKTLFVACSGGLDSTCLIHALYSLELNIRCIHVNYQLRGEDSKKDELFINEFCNNLSIPFLSKTIDLKKTLEKGGNLQQLAREFRYDWFDQLSEESEENFIILGHHRDDQIETFLLNLSRKSGVMGLASMPFKRKQIIRPLLGIKRTELENYAKENKLSWREDKTNNTNEYKRNFIRNEIIPFLKKEINTIEDSIVYLVECFQGKQKELEQIIHPHIEQLYTSNTLNKSIYLKFDGFERVEFLRQIGQPSTKAMEMTMLSSAQKGKKLELLKHDRNNWRQVINEETDFIFEPIDPIKKEFHLKKESLDQLPRDFNKEDVYLDAALIKGDLMLRRWKIGDRIQPLGMKGSKLISDIIADAKVTFLEKKDILVLHDENVIHWCVGYSIGRVAIATQDSKKIIKCYVTYSILPE